MADQAAALVIGAGIGGLAAAIRLQCAGYAVTVFDQNPYPGGKLSEIQLGDYRFDAGPSLFTAPEYIEELFALAGEDMAPYFAYTKMPVTCHYFFANGKTLHAHADPKAFDREAVEKLGEKPGAVAAYLREAGKAYQNIGLVFLNHSLHRWSTLFKLAWRKTLSALRPAYLLRSMHQWNQAHFTQAETIQLFDRYATYNGSNPYVCPAMLSMIPHLEFNQGSFYPKGGMISITNALYALAQKKGVQFHLGTRVDKILVEAGRAVGVRANGADWKAQTVVSNMDAYLTYKTLLGNQRRATKILQQERSSSALIFYWGMGKTFPSLNLHNIFFTADYAAEFKALFAGQAPFADPTVYINITSKCEPGLAAPLGKENWFVMVNAPAHQGQDWEALVPAYKTLVLKKLQQHFKEDLSAYIEEEAILTPADIAHKTLSHSGSLYGTSSNSRLAAFLRHPNQSASPKGLYFVGGSVHPGGGIPLCLSSARIMAQSVPPPKP